MVPCDGRTGIDLTTGVNTGWKFTPDIDNYGTHGTIGGSTTITPSVYTNQYVRYRCRWFELAAGSAPHFPRSPTLPPAFPLLFEF